MATIKFAPRTSKPAPAPIKPANLTDPVAKLLAVESWSNTLVVGREEVARLFILAVAARQNCLMLGPPGTAKTMSVQLIAKSFAAQPGDVFDILLTKHTKPAEFFGPFDLDALKHGKYHYLTAGYAPAAKVVIMDELFKGSSAINNSTLRLANERTFQNGNICEQCPTRSMVGMSNEFPDEPALLAAFFDRFPLKLMVKALEPQDFRRMLKLVAEQNGAKVPVVLTDADLTAIDAKVSECEINDDVLDALWQIREVLRSKGVTASDRRYAQAIRLLRAAAVLAGRDEVRRVDLKVLEYILWNTEADIAVVKATLPEFLKPFEKELRMITDEVYHQRGEVLAAANLEGQVTGKPKPDYDSAAKAASKAISKVRSIVSRLDAFDDMKSADTDDELMTRARESVTEIEQTIKAICLGRTDAVHQLLASQSKDL